MSHVKEFIQTYIIPSYESNSSYIVKRCMVTDINTLIKQMYSNSSLTSEDILNELDYWIATAKTSYLPLMTDVNLTEIVKSVKEEELSDKLRTAYDLDNILTD